VELKRLAENERRLSALQKEMELTQDLQCILFFLYRIFAGFKKIMMNLLFICNYWQKD